VTPQGRDTQAQLILSNASPSHQSCFLPFPFTGVISRTPQNKLLANIFFHVLSPREQAYMSDPYIEIFRYLSNSFISQKSNYVGFSLVI
jgi:hypothetical protein